MTRILIISFSHYWSVFLKAAYCVTMTTDSVDFFSALFLHTQKNPQPIRLLMFKVWESFYKFSLSSNESKTPGSKMSHSWMFKLRARGPNNVHTAFLSGSAAEIFHCSTAAPGAKTLRLGVCVCVLCLRYLLVLINSL